MTPTTFEAKVHDFLAQKRIAVAGVSRDKGHHPVGNLIYNRLKKSGHDVFPVNPHMQTFEGDRCYPDLQSIPVAWTGSSSSRDRQPHNGSYATATRRASDACGCISR